MKILLKIDHSVALKLSPRYTLEGSCPWTPPPHTYSFPRCATVHEHDLLMSVGRFLEEKEFWIGASDRIREGEWTWFTTLSPMNFTAWQPGEPNNSDGNENCVIIYAVDFLWNNLGCARRINFICEIR